MNRGWGVLEGNPNWTQDELEFSNSVELGHVESTLLFSAEGCQVKMFPGQTFLARRPIVMITFMISSLAIIRSRYITACGVTQVFGPKVDLG